MEPINLLRQRLLPDRKAALHFFALFQKGKTPGREKHFRLAKQKPEGFCGYGRVLAALLGGTKQGLAAAKSNMDESAVELFVPFAIV